MHQRKSTMFLNQCLNSSCPWSPGLSLLGASQLYLMNDFQKESAHNKPLRTDESNVPEPIDASQNDLLHFPVQHLIYSAAISPVLLQALNIGGSCLRVSHRWQIGQSILSFAAGNYKVMLNLSSKTDVEHLWHICGNKPFVFRCSSIMNICFLLYRANVCVKGFRECKS